jgi:hypothetical protein
MYGNRTDRQDPGFLQEFASAWIVALFFLAVGVAAISLRVPAVRDRIALQWYDPPVSAAEPAEAPGFPGPDLTTPQIGDAASDAEVLICDAIADPASQASAPVARAVHPSETPC